MILEHLTTLSGEFRSFDHPLIKGIMKRYEIEKQDDLFMIVHGKVTDFYRVIR